MDRQDLKKAGLKITLPRMMILELLETQENHHLSAEDIYRLLTNDGQELGLATVYRVLAQFETAGLVTRLNFENGQSLFELNDGEHHDHMVSTTSGRVIEFKDEVIEKRQREIAKKHGFTITDHTMILYGEFDDE